MDPVVSVSTCNKVPQSIVIDVFLSSNGVAYTVTSITVLSSSTYQNVAFKNKAVIQTLVNIKLGSAT